MPSQGMSIASVMRLASSLLSLQRDPRLNLNRPYFIQTFIDDHLRHHAQQLAG